MARSDPTDFRIEVLEGPRAGLIVSLSGRGLPHRSGAGGSFAFGSSLAVKTTWYPGNPVASQQIIGPRLRPTTVNGVWRERYLGTDAPVDLMETLQGLQRSGSQLEVSWSTITRIGVISEADFTPGAPVGGLGDLAWSLTFDWRGEGTGGARLPRAVAATPQPDIRDSLLRAGTSARSLRDALEGYSAGVATLFGSARRSSESARETLRVINQDVAPTEETLAVSVVAIGAAGDPSVGVVDAAASAAARAQVLAGQAAEATSAIFTGDVTVTDGLRGVLEDALARADMVDAAFALAEDAHAARLRLAHLNRPPDFVRVPAVVGEDLRVLARRFYGDADLWHRVAAANGFRGSVVPSEAQEVVVPVALPEALDLRIGRC